MEELYDLDHTKAKNVPEFVSNFETGTFEINGRSYPENAVETYQPFNSKLDKYIEAPQPKTTLHLRLSTCNSSTIKVLISVFGKLEEMCEEKNVETIIYWHLVGSNEDDVELGEDLNDFTDLPFEIVQ